MGIARAQLALDARSVCLVLGPAWEQLGPASHPVLFLILPTRGLGPRAVPVRLSPGFAIMGTHGCSGGESAMGVLSKSAPESDPDQHPHHHERTRRRSPQHAKSRMRGGHRVGFDDSRHFFFCRLCFSPWRCAPPFPSCRPVTPFFPPSCLPTPRTLPTPPLHAPNRDLHFAIIPSYRRP